MTYFFVAEGRAEDVHADLGGDSPQFGYGRNKASPLNIPEVAFEAARRERRREADTLGTRPAKCVGAKLRQKYEGKICRSHDCVPLDQFKNLILPVMKMSRRPEAGRSGIVKNGEIPLAAGGANLDARFFVARCP